MTDSKACTICGNEPEQPGEAYGHFKGSAICPGCESELGRCEACLQRDVDDEMEFSHGLWICRECQHRPRMDKFRCSTCETIRARLHDREGYECGVCWTCREATVPPPIPSDLQIIRRSRNEETGFPGKAPAAQPWHETARCSSPTVLDQYTGGNPC